MAEVTHGPARSPLKLELSRGEDTSPTRLVGAAGSAAARCNQWAHIDLNLSRSPTPAEAGLLRANDREGGGRERLTAISYRAQITSVRARDDSDFQSLLTPIQRSFLAPGDYVICFRKNGRGTRTNIYIYMYICLRERK